MDAFDLKKAYWAQQNANPLPAGFRRVAYIESTGTQWIDTGILLSSNSRVALSICNLTTTAGDHMLFGAKGANGPGFWVETYGANTSWYAAIHHSTATIHYDYTPA